MGRQEFEMEVVLLIDRKAEAVLEELKMKKVPVRVLM